MVTNRVSRSSAVFGEQWIVSEHENRSGLPNSSLFWRNRSSRTFTQPGADAKRYLTSRYKSAPNPARKSGNGNLCHSASVFSILLPLTVESSQLSDLPQIVLMIDAILLPFLGLTSLVWSKISQGETARFAEKQFLLSLVVITIVTLRTVIYCDDVWLVHTFTLSAMVVGALAIPNRDASVAL